MVWMGSGGLNLLAGRQVYCHCRTFIWKSVGTLWKYTNSIAAVLLAGLSRRAGGLPSPENQDEHNN